MIDDTAVTKHDASLPCNQLGMGYSNMEGSRRTPTSTLSSADAMPRRRLARTPRSHILGECGGERLPLKYFNQRKYRHFWTPPYVDHYHNQKSKQFRGGAPHIQHVRGWCVAVLLPSVEKIQQKTKTLTDDCSALYWTQELGLTCLESGRRAASNEPSCFSRR